MDTRRDFIKKAMMLSGAAGWTGLVPESISKAMAINPEPGSTYLDAEHVVILMQENRSFDHCFGTLKGVRGFNDPRRVELPGGNPVWLQSNAKGETSPPFRFDIHGTKATWMGSTPHARQTQLDAYNGGKYDRWLDAKQVGNKSYAHMPLTMGYYTREDIPFNFALADAFTVCDQNFCSAMTSTWPNRLFLWSGTIRGEANGDAKAYVRNQIPYGEANWTTFPEVLERNGVSWRVYQNDLTAGGGFVGEERAWLSNFGCNPLEYLSQYNVRFSERYVAGLKTQIEELPGEIEGLKALLAKPLPAAGQTDKEKNAYKKAVDAQEKARKDIAKKEGVLQNAKAELKQYSRENFDQLSAEAKALVEKAFISNTGDPDYRQLASLSYEENGEKRELNIPKGDIFHQFREDVNQGKLPTVSWLVGPEKFSDHPTAPWFGSWYVSEVLDILTKNPEVWKKTIFILTYDENDGYFDHVPPFVAPDPHRPETGRCSAGIDPGAEYITLENELRDGIPLKEARRGPIGLGFRVPMVVASPWSRGGRICSHVFDHTSVFRFVQDFLNRKNGSKIQETTTSDWRKTVAGHLGMVFRPYQGDGREILAPLEKQPFIKGIYNAKFKDVPTNHKVLTPEEIEQYKKDESSVAWMPHQEPGVRPSCALPYQLYADGALSENRREFTIKLEARKEVFGEASSGSPFNIFFPGKYAVETAEGQAPTFENVGYRSYAVAAGSHLAESFPVAAFEEGVYHACVHGPNGFFRECRGNSADPSLSIECGYDRETATSSKLNGKLRFTLRSLEPGKSYTVEIKDQVYGKKTLRKQVLAPHGPDATLALVFDLKDSHGWYDFSVSVTGADTYLRRYAGRVETGEDSISDPYMGRAV
jgi:phospholipase C